MSTTNGTAMTASPAWADHLSTIVEHERGDRVHPEDAGTAFDRPVARWATCSAEADPAGPATLSVSLHGRRYDRGDNDPDYESVLEGDTPGLCLTAPDARRLGQALIQAADLLDSDESHDRPVLAFWAALHGGTYRITGDGNIECWQSYANAWHKSTSLVPHGVGAPGHYESLVSAIYALQRADAEELY